ncbi:MAG: FtsH protease activity modulator HflK [Gammaproteobacteria bacterium]|nr:FtsH protease activity modulator HflK [Gammaproteobacteria bacterium]MYF39068.1 FtsH protease activity modulator HflK [Gammaproteobacteria bacterium]
MAWSDNDGKKQDPWGNQGGQQGPPDLDESFKKIQNQFKNMFSGGGGSGDKNGGGKGFKLRPWMILAIVGAAILVWVVSGFYTVDQQERAVVLRLGKLLEDLREPGLQWRPRFIDQIEIVNFTEVKQVSQQSQMLTRDENLVVVDIQVQYRVRDPKNFVVEIRNPETSLAHATESALRHVVGSFDMDSVITEDRQLVATLVQSRLQSLLDEKYLAGITVSKVVINNAGPPAQVQDAFDDVQRAKEDENRFKNDAEAYRETVVRNASGEAEQIIAEAEGYAAQVVERAQGEADRFLAILAEYQLAKDVTRDRLYITAMETVLRSTSKVLVDVDSGNNLLLLPLDQLLRNSSTQQGLPSALGGASSQTTN